MAHSKKSPCLSTLHLDNTDLIDTILHRWPTLPRYKFFFNYWEGMNNGTLVGLNEVIIVLRRMWAYDLGLLPTPKPGTGVRNLPKQNPLVMLTCSDLSSLSPDHFLLYDVVKYLGRDMCSGRDPSFEAILGHQIIALIWARGEMRLFQPRITVSTDHGVNYMVRDWVDCPDWRDELLVFKGNMKLNRFFVESFIQRLDENGIWVGCCNFPDFIRVKYIARPLEDGSKLPGFQDIRTFEIDALRLTKFDLRNNRELVPGTGKRTRRSYSLIACVFERDNQNEAVQVQTYTMKGRPIRSQDAPGVELERKIGVPGTTCFLFYAMCHKNDCNPEISPSVNASKAGTKRVSTTESPLHSKRHRGSNLGDCLAGPSNSGEDAETTPPEESGAVQQGNTTPGFTPSQFLSSPERQLFAETYGTQGEDPYDWDMGESL